MERNIANMVEFYDAIINLIVADIKFNKHFHSLNQAGLETAFSLELHNSIFVIIGFRKSQISEDLVQWYISEIDQALQLDIEENTPEMQELARNIIAQLEQIKSKLFDKPGKTGIDSGNSPEA